VEPTEAASEPLDDVLIGDDEIDAAEDLLR